MSLDNDKDICGELDNLETLNPGSLLTDEDKQRFAEENINVVYHVAKSFSNTNLDQDELISIGLLGYAKALESYRVDKNTKFSTYAINCVKNEILYMLKKEKKHRMNNDSLSKIVSTDKNGNNLHLEDIISNSAESNSDGLDNGILESEKNDMLIDIINSRLSKRERDIICHRYELNGYELKTQVEISKQLNMSQANVSKIEKNVLKKLKKFIDKTNIRK